MVKVIVKVKTEVAIKCISISKMQVDVIKQTLVEGMFLRVVLKHIVKKIFYMRCNTRK